MVGVVSRRFVPPDASPCGRRGDAIRSSTKSANRNNSVITIGTRLEKTGMVIPGDA
jgi:hypothetical protein